MVVVTGSSSVSNVEVAAVCDRAGGAIETLTLGTDAMEEEADDWPILPSRPPEERVDIRPATNGESDNDATQSITGNRSRDTDDLSTAVERYVR